MSKKYLAITLLVCIVTNTFAFGESKKKAKTSKSASKIEIDATNVPSGFYSNVWRKFQEGGENGKQEAFESLRAIVAKNFQETKAHYYLGIMYYEQGEYSMALTYFNNALPGYEDSADLYSRIGECYDKLNRRDEAANAFFNALSFDENIPSALAKLGEYDFENKNYDEALDKLNKALELEEKNITVLKILGKIHYLKAAPTLAEKYLSEAAKIDKDDYEIYLYLGKAYFELKKYANSIEALSIFLKLSKNTSDSKNKIGYLLANAYFENGEYEKACEEYQKRIKIMKNDGEGYYGLGLSYEGLGNIELALKSYIKAFKLDEKYGDKIIEYADYYVSIGEYEKAKRLNDLLKRKKDFNDEYQNISDNIKEQKKNEKRQHHELEASVSNATDYDIESNYLALYELDKNNAEVAEKLMEYYRERGYYEEALKWFKKYNKINPTSDYNRKTIEDDLKFRLSNDNLILYGKTKKPKNVYSSKLSDDDLYSIALNGDNDRLKETAFKILVSRSNVVENTHVYEDLFNFYADRGRKKDALKCASKMKSLGIINETEAANIQKRIKGN